MKLIRDIVRMELRRHKCIELGVVTSVFPAGKGNYSCNVKIRDRDVELRNVPIATQYVGLVGPPSVGDLVVIAYVNGDENHPLVVGRLYTDVDRPPTSRVGEIVLEPPGPENSELRRIAMKLPGGYTTLVFKDEETLLNVKSVVFRIEPNQNVVLSTGTRKNPPISFLYLERGGYAGLSVVSEEEAFKSGVGAFTDHVLVEYSLEEDAWGLYADSESVEVGFLRDLEISLTFTRKGVALDFKSPDAAAETTVVIDGEGVHVKTTGRILIESDKSVEVKAKDSFKVSAKSVKISGKKKVAVSGAAVSVSSKKTLLKSKKQVKVSVKETFEVSSNKSIKLGSKDSIEATALKAIKIDSKAKAQLTAKAETVIKGGVVRIN